LENTCGSGPAPEQSTTENGGAQPDTGGTAVPEDVVKMFSDNNGAKFPDKALALVGFLPLISWLVNEVLRFPADILYRMGLWNMGYIFSNIRRGISAVFFFAAAGLLVYLVMHYKDRLANKDKPALLLLALCAASMLCALFRITYTSTTLRTLLTVGSTIAGPDPFVRYLRHGTPLAGDIDLYGSARVVFEKAAEIFRRSK
jgi:hypothetical protein